MAISNNTLGYNTYILGTVKKIVTCSEIILYNNSRVSTEKISLYNINTVYREVLSSGNYIRLIRNNETDPFEYESSENFNGFNVIIYLSDSDNTPTGYTEFLNIQGEELNINIYIKFSSNIGNDIELILTNSLNQLRSNTTSNKYFIGEGLNQYVSCQEVLNNVKNSDSYSKYTTHLSSIKKDGELENILFDFGILKGSNMYKNNILGNLNIDPFEIGFNNYQIGYFGNDIVVYEWDDKLRYNIFSLSRVNKFGNPISLINNISIGYDFIPETIGNYNISKINRFSSGLVFITDEVGNNLTYSLLNSGIIEEGNNLLIDELDPKGHYTVLPLVLTMNNIYDYCPEISSSFIDLEEINKQGSITLIKKVGSWIVLRQRRSGGKNILIYSNNSMNIYINETEDDVLIINDQLIAIRTIVKEENKEYYSIYSGKGQYYSEKVKTLISPSGKLIYDNELGIYINNDTYFGDYKKLYNDKTIKLSVVGESIKNSYFKKFRRNILPQNQTLPKILGILRGIIFYLDDNKLNFL